MKDKNIDIRLFGVLIPVINVFNYYLTYTKISFGIRTLITFSLDTLEGYAAWLVVRAIIIYLDRKLPFAPQPLRRVVVQLFTTITAGMLVIIGLTELTNTIAGAKPVPVSFYTHDILIISVWFIVLNGIYLGLHLYQEWQQAEARRKEEGILRSGGFRVRQGRQEILVDYEEIDGFYVAGEYTACYTRTGKKYLLDQSIDKIERQLPVAWFFRCNRQVLLHRRIVTGFEKAENGRLNALLKPPAQIPSPVSVSRTKAAAFKKWFTPDQAGRPE